MATAIEFNQVSKKYLLRHQRTTGLKEAIPLFLTQLTRRFVGRGDSEEEFWALKDVSFELEEGKALGIIGPNGAGKSTILKLLSGITLPTKGKANVKGKVAALIEVGAGFHPDLTGRENVYLNGSIMGLKKKEIESKFDSIVEFAELEQFIDMPVKRYSSGMYVRLGFAVAVHVEPDILLVDEVLAVGDMSFQKKCINRIKEIQNTGKTIIFISHNLPVLQELCDRAIWLEDGTIKKEGESRKIIEAYVDYTNIKIMKKRTSEGFISPERWGSGEVKIQSVKLLDGAGNETNVFEMGDAMRVHINYEAFQRVYKPTFWVAVMNDAGLKINGTTHKFGQQGKSSYLEGKGDVECIFEALSLLPGIYFLVVGIFDESLSQPFDRWGKAVSFTVKTSESEAGIGLRNPDFYGVASVKSKWE